MGKIEAKQITKSFGRLQVLKGVDFCIEPATMVSIVGASGAGKTTLMQILATLSKPDSGEIFWNGKSPLDLKDNELAKFRNQHIGIVFQFHYLLPEFTALENICMPAIIAGEPAHSYLERANKWLDFFGLSNRSSHLPSELSGGEQQRVSVARALINNPEVLFADEPSGNLDSANAKEMHALLRRLKDEFNQSILIITHNHDLASLADKQMAMRDGLLFQV